MCCGWLISGLCHCSFSFFRSFRSSRESGGMTNLGSVFLLIKEMQRKFKAREAEKKEMEVCVFTCYDDVVITSLCTLGHC